LIKELEAKIIAPQVKVSEKEIKKYYEKNKKDFLKPETAEIAVIQTKDKKLIKSAIKRIKSGEDFFEVARDVQFHGALPETRRIDSLVKEVRDAVVKMKDGNISKIIKYKEWFFLVKLVKKERAKLHEFSKVKESIRKMLYSKKLMDLKNSYLNQLRKKSRITINKVLWKEISDRYKTAKHKG
jgi:parvulin-like peptidyl-prolyl isomerase